MSQVFIGFLLSAAGFAASQVCAGKLYVVKSDVQAYAYRFIGNVDFETDQGTVLHIEHYLDSAKTYVINNSTVAVVVEEINYRRPRKNNVIPGKSLIEQALDPTGGAPPRGDYFVIEPYTVEKLSIRKQTIDYFFDEEIPKEIEVYPGDEKKYWIHRVD